MLEERAAQWKDEYIQQGVIIGRLEGIEEGRAEGMAEGRAEGISIGETRGLRLALCDFLEARFGTLSPSVITHIANASDPDTLRKLTLFAFHAESLQDVIEHLKMPDKN